MIFQINKLPFALNRTMLSNKKSNNMKSELLEVVKVISTHFKTKNFKIIIGDSIFNCGCNEHECFWESEDKKPEGNIVPITVKKIEQKYIINE